MGRNQEQNQQKRDGQRARILSTSLRLFVQRGFGSTRITDISSEAGIAQGLLYRYFDSKDEILVALLEHALPRLDDAARGLEASPIPAGEKVRLALRVLLKGLDDNDDTSRYHLLVAMVSASEALPPRARTILDRHGRNPYAVMQRIFARGQKEGTVRPGSPRQMALLFWAMIKGLAIHHAVHGHSLGRPTARSIEPLFLVEDPPCKA